MPFNAANKIRVDCCGANSISFHCYCCFISGDASLFFIHTAKSNASQVATIIRQYFHLVWHRKGNKRCLAAIISGDIKSATSNARHFSFQNVCVHVKVACNPSTPFAIKFTYDRCLSQRTELMTEFNTLFTSDIRQAKVRGKKKNAHKH